MANQTRNRREKRENCPIGCECVSIFSLWLEDMRYQCHPPLRCVERRTEEAISWLPLGDMISDFDSGPLPAIERTILVGPAAISLRLHACLHVLSLSDCFGRAQLMMVCQRGARKMGKDLRTKELGMLLLLLLPLDTWKRM